MPTTSVFNGTNLILTVEGDTLGHTTSCSLSLSNDLPEATTKDSNGFQEVIYQRALQMEFEYTGIVFEREKEMPIFYRDRKIGTRRVDFFVDNKIMVELKARVALKDVHLAQAMNYLEAYKMEIGLLINFGGKSLDFKRVHNCLNRDL